MGDLGLASHQQRQLALLAQAELEHYREGMLQLCLLFGAGLSLLPAITLAFRTAPGVGVLPLAILSCLGFLVAQRAHIRLYRHLGRRPWLVMPVALTWSVVIAADGIGSAGATFCFPAMTIIVLAIAVGRPGWGWTAAAVLLLAPNLAGGLLRLLHAPVAYDPASAAALFQDAGMLLIAALFSTLIERQARHVPAAFLRMATTTRQPVWVAAVHDPPSGFADALLWQNPTPRPSRSQPSAGSVGRAPAGQPAPAPQLDVARLAGGELGLSSRELEVLLLLLGGVEEAEIGLRLAHLTPRRSAAVSRSTVNKHIESARSKIAEAHDQRHVTTQQAVALLQGALDQHAADSQRLLATIGDTGHHEQIAAEVGATVVDGT